MQMRRGRLCELTRLESDTERADAVEQLSLPCARGQLTLEGSRSVWRGHTQPAQSTSLMRFWTTSLFTVRAEFEIGPDRIHAAVIQSLAPRLNKYGYELRQRLSAGLVFERRGRPGWVPFVAVFTFPIGLVALAVHEMQRIVIATDSLGGTTTALTVYGTVPRAVCKAFADLAGAGDRLAQRGA